MSRKLLLVLMFLVFLGNAKAGTVDNILDDLITYQYSDPKIIKSPTYTGVSLGKFRFRLKNNLLNLPIYTVNPPRATLSCSGLDFDAGLISMLNLDVLGRMLEQAGSSLAWGLMIGLIYSLPGVADTFQKLNEWARLSQSLSSDVCTLGKSLGATIGKKWFNTKKDESQEYSLKENLVSTFEEAIKNYKNTLKLSELYYTFPYTYLYKSGFTDKDIADLVASFFGVVMIFPADPNSSDNPPFCLKKECMEEGNIRFVPYPPKIESIDQILYPEDTSVNVWHCDWNTLVVDGTTISVCKEIKEKTITIEKGLAGVVYEKLSTVVDTLYNGNQLEGDNASFVYAFGLSDIVNGLVLMKRIYNGTTSETYYAYLDTVSQFIALQILKQLIAIAESNVMKASGIDVANKAPSEVFTKILNNVRVAKKEMQDRIDELESGLYAIRGLREVFYDIKSEVDVKIRKKFGSFLSGVNYN